MNTPPNLSLPLLYVALCFSIETHAANAASIATVQSENFLSVATFEVDGKDYLFVANRYVRILDKAPPPIFSSALSEIEVTRYPLVDGTPSLEQKLVVWRSTDFFSAAGGISHGQSASLVSTKTGLMVVVATSLHLLSESPSVRVAIYDIDPAQEARSPTLKTDSKWLVKNVEIVQISPTQSTFALTAHEAPRSLSHPYERPNASCGVTRTSATPDNHGIVVLVQLGEESQCDLFYVRYNHKTNRWSKATTIERYP